MQRIISPTTRGEKGKQRETHGWITCFGPRWTRFSSSSRIHLLKRFRSMINQSAFLVLRLTLTGKPCLGTGKGTYWIPSSFPTTCHLQPITRKLQNEIRSSVILHYIRTKIERKQVWLKHFWSFELPHRWILSTFFMWLSLN